VTTQAVQDICHLIAEYAHALDDGRTEDVVATFCPDATVVVPGQDALVGRDAIRTAYAGMVPRRPQRHVVVNTVVAVSDETASATSDLLVLAKGESGWAVELVGRYRDELRRTDSGWRFAARTLEFA
jgi:uncharacterized protein (TIGR02246 family)